LIERKAGKDKMKIFYIKSVMPLNGVLTAADLICMYFLWKFKEFH